MSQINTLHYPTLLAAWEGINEHLFLNGLQIKEQGGGVYGTEIISYNNIITVNKTWIDPEFDFGKSIGYKNKKWSKLINNYVDFRYLDLVRSEVREREAKRAKSYNYTFHFDNSHGSGKDCLISLTFMRKLGQDEPVVIYNTRASEATKRMIFDFLLIQRIVEYVYGPEKTVELIAFIPFMFINVESFLIYLGYKGGKKWKAIKKMDSPTLFQQRILKRWDEFQEKPLEEIKFRVHKRAAAQIKMDEEGNPLHPAPSMKAKDLELILKSRKFKDKDIAKLNEGMLL